MSVKKKVKEIVISAMCLALCVILPFAFHMIPNSGAIFSPIHIPVLVCGLVCGPFFGSIVGIFGPLLCMAFTGMPTLIGLPGMIGECLIYGLISGLCIKFIKTKYLILNLYISLIISMILGRVVGGLINSLVLMNDGYSIALWATSYFVMGWPGILIQLSLIPTLIFSLSKAKLIETNCDFKTHKSVIQNQQTYDK